MTDRDYLWCALDEAGVAAQRPPAPLPGQGVPLPAGVQHLPGGQQPQLPLGDLHPLLPQPRRQAVVQGYSCKASRTSMTVEAFGEDEPVATAPSGICTRSCPSHAAIRPPSPSGSGPPG